MQQDGGSIKSEAVETLISNWKVGALAAEKDPVIAVTSDTFEEVVINNDRDVFVEFYAPWCGHCKSLAPTYKQIAQHYEKDPEISIVKVDSTKHKHKSADVKSFPTLKFYKKGKKGAQVWMLQNYLMMYGLVSCCAIAMERSLRM